MAKPRTVEIGGLKDFRRELKKVGDEFPDQLKKFNKDLADDVARVAEAYAVSMGGVHAKAAPAIKGYGTATEASIGFPAKSARYPYASVAFWGAKKHTGWYRHINSDEPQHPEWVGNSWDAGRRGEGPYAINDAVAQVADDVADRYGELIERLTAQAFPNT